MMAVHDEWDVLAENLDWYRRAGLPTVVLIDEHPDGRCRQICERALADGTVIALESIKTESFEWQNVLARLVDEFFEVADGSPLRDALERDFEAGYNQIKFHNMEFAMTRVDDPTDPSPLTRMRHYSLWDVSNFRAFPCVDGLDLMSELGHRPRFPDPIEDRQSPRRYISRHYPLRTPEQALPKIRRTRPSEQLPTAGTHYLRFSGNPEELFVDPALLSFYAEDHQWCYEERFLSRRLQHTAQALGHAEVERSRLSRDLERLQVENAELRSRLARVEGRAEVTPDPR
jgi:hypothetical protein